MYTWENNALGQGVPWIRPRIIMPRLLTTLVNVEKRVVMAYIMPGPKANRGTLAGQSNDRFQFNRGRPAEPFIMPLELIGKIVMVKTKYNTSILVPLMEIKLITTGKRVMGYTMHLQEIMLIPTG